MKRILLLVMLALTICPNVFAAHTPDKDELIKVQQTFSGYHYAQDPDELKKFGLINLRFEDDYSVEFVFNGVKHIIKQSNLEVDYNNGFTASVFGKCVEPNCNMLYVGFAINTEAQIIVPKHTSFIITTTLTKKDKTTEQATIWTYKM